MSVDLTLMPMRTLSICYTRTEMPVWFSYDVQQAIKALPSAPVPGDFLAPRSGEERLTVDDYGEPLRMVHAGDLLRVATPEWNNIENMPVRAYLAALPPNQWVVLYWD